MFEPLIITLDRIVCTIFVLIGLTLVFAGRFMVRIAVSFAIALLLGGIAFGIVYSVTESWFLSTAATLIVFFIFFGLSVAFFRIAASVLFGMYIGKVIGSMVALAIGVSGISEYVIEIAIAILVAIATYMVMNIALTIIVVVLGFFLLLTGFLGLGIHEISALIAALAISIAGAIVQLRGEKAKETRSQRYKS